MPRNVLPRPGVEGGGAVQVLQLPLVEFILAPAPAVRLRLDAASTQAAAGVLGPAGRLLLVIREGLGDKELPELRGGLVDGCVVSRACMYDPASQPLVCAVCCWWEGLCAASE